MKHLQKAASLLFGVLLILHGVAHGPGVLGSWNMTTSEDISHHPNILLEHADDGAVSPLGVLFLLAGLTFIGAGIGVLRRAPWWPPAVAAALSLSLVVTILWSKDAIAGLVINIAVLIVLGLIALGSHLQQQNRGLRQAKPV